MQHSSIAFTFMLIICLCIVLDEIDAKNKFKFKIKNKFKFCDSHSHSHERWHDNDHYRSGSNSNECEAEYKSEDWYGQKDKIEGGKQICPIGVNTCVKFKCETIGFKYKYKGCGYCSDVYFELAKGINGKSRFELDRLGCECKESDAKNKYEHMRSDNGSSFNKIYGQTISIMIFAIGVFASLMFARH